MLGRYNVMFNLFQILQSEYHTSGIIIIEEILYLFIEILIKKRNV